MRDDLTPIRAGKLRATLADISESYPLIDFPLPEDGVEGGRPPFGPRLPLSAAVLASKRQARDTLRRWVSDVAASRELPARPHRGVPAEADWLALHCTWIAEQWPDAFIAEGKRKDEHRDLYRVAKDLHGLAHPSGRRRIPIDVCPLEHPEFDPIGYDDEDQVHDVPTLIAELQGDNDWTPTVVACTADPAHQWPPGRWLFLGRRLEQARQERERHGQAS